MASKTPDRKGFDWSVAGGEPASPPPDPAPAAGRAMPGAPSASAAPAPAGRLMDLCLPVFAYASMLPREAGVPGPAYEPFRDGVLGTLRRIESDAAPRGLDREDAREAAYALALFVDEQIAESEWSERLRWAGEPLHIVLHEDPEGGINFFRRMDALADRQTEVREVYLSCLAFGYRGKYAELETTQQAAQLGALRQRLVREIQREPIDKLPQLFPGGYRPAQPPAAAAATAPRWWMWAGIGTAAACLLLWVVLYVLAARAPRAAEEVIRPLATSSAMPAAGGAR